MVSILLATAALSCYNVGYTYDAETTQERYFSNINGLVLATYVNAVRAEPNPRARAKALGLCTDYPAA